ncbi:MAG: preprotein translocase subunit SecG [Asticcacaulis sp.]|nr:preprotein translocase subunit SecG [Asticcacaulis sp.]
MLFYILLTVQILICVSLAGLVLIQRSEGGALGMGGGPSGFMSARGAGNLLTRLTAIFGILFFANSIGLTIVGNLTARTTSAVDQIDTSKLPASNALTPPAAQAPAAATSSSAAPSLNDLPLAGAAAPVVTAKPATAPTASLGPSINLSMPSQTTTGKVDLPKSPPNTVDIAPKAAAKPVQKTASSASSTSSIRSSSAAPSSTAPSSVAPSSSASSAPVTPASSQ